MAAIDYSMPKTSRYLLWLDAPFRYSSRHLVASFTSRIVKRETGIELMSKLERRIHFCLAFCEVLPVIGIAVALLDRLFFSTTKRALNRYMLNKLVPFYCKLFGPDAQTDAKKAIIASNYSEEMKQFALSANSTYDSVLLENSILDRLFIFGGSIIGKSDATKKVATNYFHSQGRDNLTPDVCRSFWRFDMLQKSEGSIFDALKKVNMQETIASCIYDGKKQKLYYAFGSEFAANRPYKTYDLSKFLPQKYSIILGQNIDIPMGLLAPCTTFITHKKTAHTNAYVAISWLGMSGAYFGINEYGIAIAATNVPNISRARTPNHLIIRKILEEAKSHKEAQDIIEKSPPSASMNIIMACQNELYRIELAKS